MSRQCHRLQTYSAKTATRPSIDPSWSIGNIRKRRQDLLRGPRDMGQSTRRVSLWIRRDDQADAPVQRFEDRTACLDEYPRRMSLPT